MPRSGLAIRDPKGRETLVWIKVSSISQCFRLPQVPESLKRADESTIEKLKQERRKVCIFFF